MIVEAIKIIGINEFLGSGYEMMDLPLNSIIAVLVHLKPLSFV